ncbi:hypothetical protein ES332_D13G153200v1, partial [Gossypium tomentosum]
PDATAPGAIASTSFTWGGSDLVAVGGKVALLPISLGTADFFVHHIHAFTIHVTVLIHMKGVLFSRSSHLIPDKANLDFHFPCDGLRRGGHVKCSFFVWNFSLMFLFSGRGYWQELVESIVWDHNKLKVAPDLKGIIALIFPRFSQGLAQEPTTRRIWFGIAIAHDFESHDDVIKERLYQNIFASHFGQLAIIFLWTSGNLFHVAWQGNFEAWVQDPLHVRLIAHVIWDPHFGRPMVEAFTRGGAPGQVNIAYSGVYQWWYTIELSAWLHLQTKWKPNVSWFKNVESRLNHHLSGLFGVSSLAWTGHLVHVAIPGSRGEYWNLYAQNPDSSSHLFGTSQGSGTTIVTLLGGFHRQRQNLWLTNIAHHHLAIVILFLIAGHMYRTNFGIGHSIKDLFEAHIPLGG